MSRLLAGASLGLLCAFNAVADGAGTSGDPFTTLSDAYGVSSGRYYFNTGSGLFQADVDNDEGGGWVLALQYVHQGGTNPNTTVIGAGADFPVTSTAALGTDESLDTTQWGHAGNAAFSQFPEDIELRWYAETNAHTRKIHFRSTVGDDYWRTGSGSVDGIATDFTSLTGHTANLPAAATNYGGGQGDSALTYEPYFQVNNYHWGINLGLSTRWEVDDYAANNAQDTIHRVWVRTTAPLEVTNTNDSGVGSLRQAITVANAAAALDEVTFNIDGTGPHKITFATTPPGISDWGITIDGTTQSGASCGDLWNGTPHTLMVELHSATTAYSPIRIFGNSALIKGLSLTGGNRGVYIDSATANNTVQCNYIGLAPDGTSDGNLYGVEVGGANTLIGGLTAVGHGNVISGNSGPAVLTMNGSTGTLVRGNFIGTDPTGTAARANSGAGITHNSGTGTWTDITKNLISKNTSGGILTNSNDTVSGASGDVIIAGNYIGTNRAGTTALSNGSSGILFTSNSISGVTIGGTNATDRNVISGNVGAGLELESVDDIDIFGNYIGVGADGLTSTRNASRSFFLTSVSNLNIGNGVASGRNVIAQRGARPVRLVSGADNLSISGNYFGTDASGNVSLQNGSGSAEDAIVIAAGTYNNISVTDNIIGGFGGDGMEISVSAVVSGLVIQGNSFGVGADGVTALPMSISAPAIIDFRTGPTVSGLVLGGTGIGEGNVIANSLSKGINITSDVATVSGTISGNTIYNNADDGITQKSADSNVAIYSNSIYNNGGLGIDLGTDGVTTNDSGDSDTGANELLNFPVINTVGADGSTSVAYDFNLDVPSATNGYRIEFFKNSASNSSGYGEGEAYLGFTDIAHAGGDLNFTGTFTASESVSVGDVISATTTRKTGASTYDATSEFALNKVAETSISPLIVTSTADTDTLGTLRYAINYANANALEDAISFELLTSDANYSGGIWTISTLSVLPALSDDNISIDGTTQSGASCGDLWGGTPHTLNIQIDAAGGSYDSFELAANNISLRGLSMTRASMSVHVQSGADNASLTCSYLGIAPDGTAAGNSSTGVYTEASNTVFGGLTTGDGNVIGSNQYGVLTNNAQNVTIQGNFIGTDPTGTSARGNTELGLGNGFTGSTVNEIRNNLISGNQYGFIFQADDTWTGVGGADFVIAGNYIGTDRTGNVALPNTSDGINFTSGSVSNLVLGGLNTADRNIISGNGGEGIEFNNAVTDASILGNYIGIGADGTTELGNSAHGIFVTNIANLNIGNGSASGRNVISNNGYRGIDAEGTTSDTVISGNYIGTDATGNNVLTNAVRFASGSRDGIAINAGVKTNVSVTDNVIGGFQGAGIEFWLATGSGNLITGNNIGIGADGVTDVSGPSGFAEAGVLVGYSTFGSIDVTVGGIGLGNTVENASGPGVSIRFRDGVSVVGNTLRNNGGDGVTLTGGSEASIMSNAIYQNGGIAINLEGGTQDANGVTANDSGDSDTGVNDLLNFPVINTLEADGTTSLAYDFNLDAPSATNGYRVEFFKNNAADSSGYGEGEIYLGFADIVHAGGDLNFTGTFTASESVSVGDIISATTTRKTGASTYDATSEFALNKVAEAPPSPLIVTSTADTDTLGTLRYAINYANANALEDAITFEIDGEGPHRITLSSRLPALSDDNISIDGTTQSGASCGDLWGGTPHTLKITIDGNNIGDTVIVYSANAILRGLSIVGAPSNKSGLFLVSSGVSLTCSYVGVEPDGTENSNGHGVTPRGADIEIGGSNIGDGNVIAYNTTTGILPHTTATNLTIEGNFIGSDATGLISAANGIGIFYTGAGTRSVKEIRNNLISGNSGDGVYLGENTNVTGASGDAIIAGNYIGTDRTGVTALSNGGIGISFETSSISGVTIGGTNTADRNIISGNVGESLLFSGVEDIDVFGNYIGVGADGLTNLPNGILGIHLEIVSDVNIGNGIASGRNVIAQTGGRAIRSISNVDNLSIAGNYLGTDASGNVSLQKGLGTSEDAIVISSATYNNISVTDNVVGGYGGSGIEVSVSAVVSGLVVQGNSFGVGADGVTALPMSDGGTAVISFLANTSVSGLVLGGTGGGEGNVIANSLSKGVHVIASAGTISGTISGNTIYDNADDGIGQLNASSNVAIYSNSIYNNGGLGIDLGTNGVTANDSGDSDTGANELLNFPVINTVEADGSTSIAYDFNLDAPSATNGYRIEFFKNSTADSSGYGEGEIYLGFADISHAGGDLNFTGTFTAAEALSVGDIITATTTRKTGASTYDATSEFALNKVAEAPPSPLIVTSTADTDTLGTLRYAINYARANVDEDDITFNIPTSDGNYANDVWTISLLSSLSTLSDENMHIDGTSQPGASCGQLTTGTPHTLKIALDGSGTVGTAFGPAANNVKISGLSIGNFEDRAIEDATGTSGLELSCNYIGVKPDGVTAIPVSTGSGFTPAVLLADSTNVTIDNNLISGNAYDSADRGIYFSNVSDAVVTGNIIGLTADGTAALGNGGEGLVVAVGSTNVTIGGTTAATRNVISGNGTYGIHIDGTASNITLLGNYIGTDVNGTASLGNGSVGVYIQGSNITIGDGSAAGRNVISGSKSTAGIYLNGGSTISILGNYIGTNAAGTAALKNTNHGIQMKSVSDVDIGMSGQGNVISGNKICGIASQTNVIGGRIRGNLIGVAADGVTALGNGYNGICTTSTDLTIGGLGAGEGNLIANSDIGLQFQTGVGATSATVYGNIIHSNTLDGITVAFAANVAILQTTFYNNAGIAIDLSASTSNDSTAGGVSTNDSGDADTGGNDILNFPVINIVEADGSTSIAYDFDLDVPSATNGYRVEFFKNSTADSSSYGEGEIYLGFVDVAHAGGDLNFTGTFTAAEALSVGDIISATTTRKTGASTYDATSEFALNKVAEAPNSSLIVTSTADTDTLGTLRYAINYANDNALEDAITFALPTSDPNYADGIWTLTTLSALPTLTDDGMSIDGITQDGAACGQLTTGTQHTLKIMIDGNAVSARGMLLSGDDITVRGFSIVGFGYEGFKSTGSGSVLECSYLGIETDGITGNRNAASGGGATGIVTLNSAPNFIVRNNVISYGTKAGVDGIRIEAGSKDGFVTGNIIGLDASGTFDRGTVDAGIVLQDPGSSGVTIGGVTPETRNVISGNDSDAVRLRVGVTGSVILGNYIGLTRDGTGIVANNGRGIELLNASTGHTIGDGTSAGANWIVGNNASGIALLNSSQAAILANVIHSNGNVGIDLTGDGVTQNDSGDADTGDNNLLNFPVINSFITTGGASIAYDINLDVPSNAEGYRIEFFKNSAAHSIGYGDGETFLGFIDVSHSGGDTQFTGTFTANQSIADNDIIAATTTRKTATGYDITSEFSFATTSATPTVLDASKAITVYDPLNEGLFSMPGNDVVYALTVTNPGGTSSDKDSIVIIDLVPSELMFYNDDVDDGGTETNPVSFTQENGAGLIFTYATDVKYSNSASKPTEFDACVYTPMAGYDANVTYVCFNPKGAMASGDPDPSFTLKFRAQIK